MSNKKGAETKASGGVFYLKARIIRSGETPQKSIILPPVHPFIKRLVTPVNMIFSCFFKISRR